MGVSITHLERSLAKKGLLAIIEDVTRDTIQSVTDGIEGGEADGSGFTSLEN